VYLPDFNRKVLFNSCGQHLTAAHKPGVLSA
jgi:hypothetical protein